MRRRLGPRQSPPPQPASRFTPELLEGVRDDLVSGKLGDKGKVVVSDDVQTGLRALIRATGLISFHAHYSINGERPYMVVGHHPETSINDARQLTKTIRGLADQGIDVAEGLHARLLRELRRDGLNWRP